MKFLSKSEQQTIDFGKKVAKRLQNGDIILLNGDLGAGKTHFVKGLAQGLGSDEVVTSPTFTIHNIYEGGRLTLNHFDMYRLASAEEALALGLEEYFDKKTLDGVSVVEWPENVEGLIQKPTISVAIQKIDDCTREITLRRAK